MFLLYSNVVVLSPKMGTFAARLVDSGAAVRVGDLQDLLFDIRDVFCVICNTIMTAPIVVDMAARIHPVVWILHEWWDDEMIKESLRIRNYQNMTLETVKHALAVATKIVFVCESQRQLYNPSAPSSVIFVGVPDPLPRHMTADDFSSIVQNMAPYSTLMQSASASSSNTTALAAAAEKVAAAVEQVSSVAPTESGSYVELSPAGSPSNKTSTAATADAAAAYIAAEAAGAALLPTPALPPVQDDSAKFNLLCLGIVCPRKNQLWTVQLFKKFAADKPNARLKIVGCRYTRTYEIEYIEQLKVAIGDDPRIELLDVTDNVDPLYQAADAVILTSLNEVTPMVISEALSWSIPVLSTNIAGIPEMFTDGKEGFLFSPGDDAKALAGMESLYRDRELRNRMGLKARLRFESTFDLDLMVDSYRQLILAVAPPVILLDMDGCLVDWDKGFMQKWIELDPLAHQGTYTPGRAIDRSRSYYMEECILDSEHREEAVELILSRGMFADLEPMPYALEAVQEMLEEGLQLYLCTSPIKKSKYCAIEKLEWVERYLGEEWIDRVIMCHDKVRLMMWIIVLTYNLSDFVEIILPILFFRPP
jgi:glycosyltransferase involved in cell wall biosynthesis/5'(3')-deoxyribonucleotidase